jgi:hypothetical protein
VRQALVSLLSSLFLAYTFSFHFIHAKLSATGPDRPRACLSKTFAVEYLKLLRCD